jgi:hypothetical protein
LDKYGKHKRRCLGGHTSWQHQECFLKGGAQQTRIIKNECRISGLVKHSVVNHDDAGVARSVDNMCTLHALIPVPPIIDDTGSSCGHFATKLMLNNKPAPFLAGILSQGFW